MKDAAMHLPHSGSLMARRAAEPRRAAPLLPSSHSLARVLDAMDVGVLLCRASGGLVLANAAGREELRSEGPLKLAADGRVTCSNADDQMRLGDALAASATGRHQLLQFAERGHVSSLSFQPFEDPDHAEPLVLLLLGRRRMGPELVVEMLCQLHALTPAERRVLSGLLQGQNVEQLAVRHGVKVSTVRSQVAALRSKLGVKRISDATRMAAELPPMAGSVHRGGLLS